MSSLSSWDYLFKIPGDDDLDCILISYFSREMVPPVAKSSRKSVESSAQEIPGGSPPPIYWDTCCNINKTTKLSWFVMYYEFSKKNILEDKEYFKVHINIKRSWLHKMAMHPPIFSCEKTIGWILQNTNTTWWVIRSHTGEAFVAVSSMDIATYYIFFEREETFNTK